MSGADQQIPVPTEILQAWHDRLDKRIQDPNDPGDVEELTKLQRRLIEIGIEASVYGPVAFTTIAGAITPSEGFQVAKHRGKAIMVNKDDAEAYTHATGLQVPGGNASAPAEGSRKGRVG